MEVVGGDRPGLGPKCVLIEKSPILVHQAEDRLWGQYGLPVGEYQMEADAQSGAGQPISSIGASTRRADNAGGTGDDSFPVRFKNAPRHAWGTAKVISIDDQSPIHLLPQVWITSSAGTTPLP